MGHLETERARFKRQFQLYEEYWWQEKGRAVARKKCRTALWVFFALLRHVWMKKSADEGQAELHVKSKSIARSGSVGAIPFRSEEAETFNLLSGLDDESPSEESFMRNVAAYGRQVSRKAESRFLRFAADVLAIALKGGYGPIRAAVSDQEIEGKTLYHGHFTVPVSKGDEAST